MESGVMMHDDRGNGFLPFHENRDHPIFWRQSGDIERLSVGGLLPIPMERTQTERVLWSKAKRCLRPILKSTHTHSLRAEESRITIVPFIYPSPLCIVDHGMGKRHPGKDKTASGLMKGANVGERARRVGVSIG